jgi:hypothetical protein
VHTPGGEDDVFRFLKNFMIKEWSWYGIERGRYPTNTPTTGQLGMKIEEASARKQTHDTRRSSQSGGAAAPPSPSRLTATPEPASAADSHPTWRGRRALTRAGMCGDQTTPHREGGSHPNKHLRQEELAQDKRNKGYS